MTNRYWNTPKGQKPELSAKETKELINKLRNEGVPEHEILFEVMRTEQRRIRALLSTQVPHCTITNEPCIDEHGYCSQCPIEVGE